MGARENINLVKMYQRENNCTDGYLTLPEIDTTFLQLGQKKGKKFAKLHHVNPMAITISALNLAPHQKQKNKKGKKVLILILYVSNYNPRGGKCGKGFLKEINVCIGTEQP